MQHVSQLVVAVAMITILFGTGLGITVESFRSIARHPAAFLCGILVQIVLLPAAALGIGSAMQAGSTLTVGLVIIAASPGNASSPLLTRLARGDVALSMTMLAATTLLSAVTVPAVLGLTKYFKSDIAAGANVSSLRIALSLFLLTTLPTAAGMLARRFRPVLAQRLEQRFPVWGTIVLLVLIAVVLHAEWEHVKNSVVQCGVAIVLLNVAAIVLGLTLPRMLGATPPERIAIAINCGLRNCGVAAVISLTLLNDAALVLPAFAYAAFMWISSGLTALHFGHRRDRIRIRTRSATSSMSESTIVGEGQ